MTEKRVIVPVERHGVISPGPDREAIERIEQLEQMTRRDRGLNGIAAIVLPSAKVSRDCATWRASCAIMQGSP